MDRKIGEIFNNNNRRIKVVLNDEDDIGYIYRRRPAVHCNKRCTYYCSGKCMGILGETGDCQPRYRKDHEKVYFTELK